MSRNAWYLAALVVTMFSVGAVASSQTATTPAPATKPATAAVTTKTPAPYPQVTPNTAEEREKIWNSPQMLRARAWVQDYCSHSAKVTPEQAKEYQAELENLTPAQMKLWLVKFDHEQEVMEQQQAAFNQSRQASLGAAAAGRKATQQAYQNINRDENEAAQTAESSLQETQQFSQEMALQKTADRDAAATSLLNPLGGWGGYGGFGYGGYGSFGGGDVHFHTHYHQ